MVGKLRWARKETQEWYDDYDREWHEKEFNLNDFYLQYYNEVVQQWVDVPFVIEEENEQQES